MKSERIVLVLLLGMAVAGCGVAQRMQAQEQARQLASQSDAATANCNAKIPGGNPKTMVPRIKCLNEALAIRMPLFGSDQDLALAFMADRVVIAEQVQNGRMTIAQGDAAIAEKWSRSVSESQHRRNATMSVVAQQNAAAAQQSAASAANTAAWASVMQATRPPPAPVTCMTTGTMTTCN